MAIGVANDFRSTSHSDELWFQGGGRLCYNAGAWDSELNSIIGTPGVGSSYGGFIHEWRISNSVKMTLTGSGSGDLIKARLTIPIGDNYEPSLQLGTNTTYVDDQLMSLRWGGNINMGMGLHSSGRGTFGKQGLALHIPSMEEFSVKTIGWNDIFSSDGATKKAYFAGNVGIGRSSPTAKLDVNGSIQAQYLGVPTGDVELLNLINRPTNTHATSFPDYSFVVSDIYDSTGIGNGKFAMRYTGSTNDAKVNRLVIDNTGNVGIGTTSPQETFDVLGSFRVGNGDGMLTINSRSSAYGQETVGLQTTIDGRSLSDANPGTHGGQYRNALALQPDGGYVGIGRTNPAFQLDVIGQIRANQGFVTSDDRLKHNEVIIASALSVIRKLSPQRYDKTLEMKAEDFNGKIEGDYTVEAGLIAQEILEIPELSFVVSGGDRTIENEEGVENTEPDTYAVDYNSIFTYNVAATQELDELLRLERLKTAALESQMAKILNRLTALEN